MTLKYSPRPLEQTKFLNFAGTDMQNFAQILEDGTFTPFRETNLNEFPSQTILPATMLMKYSLGAYKTMLIEGTVPTQNRLDRIPLQFYVAEFVGDSLVEDRRRNNNSSMNRVYKKLVKQSMTFMVVEITLPHMVPHVRVHPEGGKFVRALTKLNGSNVAQLEGNFNDFFTVETTAGNEINGWQLLPPDTMVALMDKVPDVRIEYFGNKIFIIIPNKQSMFGSIQITNHNGEVTRDDMKYNYEWTEFGEMLTTIFNKIAPELVDSAKIAKVDVSEVKSLNVGFGNLEHFTQPYMEGEPTRMSGDPETDAAVQKVGNTMLIVKNIIIFSVIAIIFGTFGLNMLLQQ